MWKNVKQFVWDYKPKEILYVSKWNNHSALQKDLNKALMEKKSLGLGSKYTAARKVTTLN